MDMPSHLAEGVMCGVEQQAQGSLARNISHNSPLDTTQGEKLATKRVFHIELLSEMDYIYDVMLHY